MRGHRGGLRIARFSGRFISKRFAFPFAFKGLHFQMFNKSSLLIVLIGTLSLAGCAYIIDEQMQEMTIETPGAHNAVCYAYVEGLRYKFRPPQTHIIAKSHEDLIIDCLAPGNRRQKVYIEPHFPKSIYGNVANGVVPGVTWDVLSSAAFQYPDVVEVNFENTPIKPENLPAQNQPDIIPPEAYDLEEFLPSTPRLNSDRFAPKIQIQRRERSSPVRSGPVVSESVTQGATDSTKGALPANSIFIGPDAAINPAGTPTPLDSSIGGGNSPIPLFPGE